MSDTAETETSQRRVLSKSSLGIAPGLPLTVSEGGIEQLRADIQRLMDIEAIKQLKYAYLRCVDTANLEELATLCHDEVSAHFMGGTYEWKLQGKQEYLDKLGAAYHKRTIGQHNGHHPEIQLLSDTEATGIWYLADSTWNLDHKAVTSGTALYWERYLKVEGRWLIKDTRYERLYEINRVLEENPPLSSHYLGTHGHE